MIVVNLEQGSEEWIKEKLGKPSASNASKLLTTEGKPSKQRGGYMDELAAEIITGRVEEGYSNGNMSIMGNGREEESRKLYEMMHDVEVTKVGVVYKDEKKQFLCSPDGIIKNQYGLELKNVLGKTQVGRLRDNCLPTEYFSQVQFSLYVTGFEYWDFMSYSPAMKSLVIRVQRDEKFIKALAVELEMFCDQLQDLVNQIK